VISFLVFPQIHFNFLTCREVWLTTKRISLLPSTSKTAVAQSTETRAEIDERMELYKRLLDVRTKLASDLDCMPYMVASNATLMCMSRLKPKSLDELRNLNSKSKHISDIYLLMFTRNCFS
jgi:superfamily II DNA helicase RecQ